MKASPDQAARRDVHCVVLGGFPVLFAPIIRPLLPDSVRLTVLGQSAGSDEIADALAGADAVVCTAFGASLPPAPHLKLLQVAAAGTDGIDFDHVPLSATVCNCFGHEQAIGEFAIMAMLALSRRLIDVHAGFAAGSWKDRASISTPFMDELGGRTVGILGFGHIGRVVARLSRAFGMRVVAANRTAVAEPAAVDRVVPLDDLCAFMDGLDFLVVTLPKAEETVGIIGAREIAALPRRAMLINVGRGAVVDEAALYHALRDGLVAGAAIDVWYQYPTAEDPGRRPSRFPFHELPNVIMSPHVSAWTTGMANRRAGQIAGNLRALSEGTPFANMVRPGLLPAK